MYKVACIGILTSCDIIFAGLKEMPTAGREIFCEEFKIRAGGCANTPVALAKLGISTTLLTRLGGDILGGIVYRMMESAGLDMSGVIVDKDYGTCVSAVLSVQGNRGFATYYDSGKQIADEDIEKVVLGCEYVFSDVGTCLALPHIVNCVQKYHRKLVIDTGWLENMELEKIRPILDCAEIFSPNDMEARQITGEAELGKALDMLAKHARVAIIKRGKDGAVAQKGKAVFAVPARREFREVDTTGAGDLFNAGFLFGYLQGWDIEKCLRMGNLTGGFSIGFTGGMDDSFTLENLSKYIDF